MQEADTLSEKADEIADFLSAVANRNRLLILSLLAGCEMNVGELAELAGLQLAAASQSLTKLRDKNMVHCRRDGQNVFYSISSDQVFRLLVALELLFVAVPEEAA